MSALTSAIEEAIFDWVVAGSELDEDHVIWEDERGPQPQGCYIAMQVGDERSFGADWSKTSLIESSDEDNGEIMYTLTGTRVLTLVLECFAAGEDWQTARPAARLARVITARRLPSIAFALSQARVGIGTIQPVQVLKLERAKIFESRARVEINLHLVAQVSETAPWIETVELTVEPNEDGETPLESVEVTITRPPET